MSYSIPNTNAETDMDEFHRWDVAIPDKFRDRARSLENDEWDNERTLYNSLLAESILRDRILPFVNNEASFEADTFEPSARPGGRYDKLQVQLSVPRDIGDQLIDAADDADFVPKDYARRVYHNNPTEEYILRKLILGNKGEVEG
jgi:hypothetical protein